MKFHKSRSIQDNFLLVRQSARLLHQQKRAAFLLKLDIAQAFDSLSWPFLLEVLTRKGFGPKWREWLSVMFRLASTRVFINGNPGRPISHGQGLRQGDPLSPLLFIIAMDVLNNLLAVAESASLLQPIGGRQGIPHRLSLYADDAVVFLSPVATDLHVIKQILQLFGEASGLHTNLAKSFISPIRCNTEQTQLITNELTCAVSDFPCKYLGRPLSLRRPSRADFQPLIDKVANRLQAWQAGMMSQGGRLVLVRAVLTSIPVYSFMAFDPPLAVIKEIDKRRRAFLWKGTENVSGGYCLVAWSTVCRPL